MRATMFFELDNNMGYLAFAAEPVLRKRQRAVFAKVPLFVTPQAR